MQPFTVRACGVIRPEGKDSKRWQWRKGNVTKGELSERGGVFPAYYRFRAGRAWRRIIGGGGVGDSGVSKGGLARRVSRHRWPSTGFLVCIYFSSADFHTVSVTTNKFSFSNSAAGKGRRDGAALLFSLCMQIRG
jgi:hypothetical protein